MRDSAASPVLRMVGVPLLLPSATLLDRGWLRSPSKPLCRSLDLQSD